MLISCALHDYIEIACLYRYQLKLRLKDNHIITGKAINIISVEQREYLLLDNDIRQKVELININELEVLTPHAKFNKVNF